MTAAPRPTRPPRPHLAELVAAVPGCVVDPGAGTDDAGPAVEGVTLDSRAVSPGDLYAALPGANVHGARFAADAVAAGAVAVLTDPAGLEIARAAGVDVPILVADDPRARLGALAAAAYGEPSRQVTTVGITGTNGKTTTAYIVEAALRELGRTTGLIGTIETVVAGERVPSVRTTPESCDLHRLFAVMREHDVDACCMEVSSHALALHRVDGALFDVAVFTNLSQDHLDFHRTMEEYYLAKASLFTPERSRAGVVCVDDAWGARLAREARVPVTTLSSRAPDDPSGAGRADWHLVADGDRLDFTLVAPERDERLELRSALPGAHNRINTALAALVLLALDVPARDAERALAAGASVPGRMQRVDLGAGAPLAFVDFAHTPDAVAATLSALRPQTTGRLVAVLGAGGDRDPGKRPAMGAAAAAAADVVVVTDDNPRHEDPAAIRASVASGAREAAGRHTVVHDVAGRPAGIDLAVAEAGPDGLVAVLGKGHEQGQTIGAETRPFDDATELRRAWNGRAGGPTTQEDAQ